MEEIIKKDPKVVDILPLKKGKRILTFLADLFLNFIFSFALFSFLVTPVAKAITGFEELNEEHEVVSSKMYSLFYKNKLVYKSNDYPEYDLVDNIDYTYNYFISFYACDDQIILSDEAYGNKLENQVIYHYFSDLMPGDRFNNLEGYHTVFVRYDNNTYFEGATTTDANPTAFKLKQQYKDQIKAKFDSRDEISEIGMQYFNEIKEKVYLPLFAEVMQFIGIHDLSHSDVDMSYLQCRTRINELENYHKVLLSSCALISYVSAAIIYYLVIPCIISNKKTLAMLLMRIERVDYPSLEHIRNSSFIGSFAFSMLSNASLMFLLPLTLVPFNILFTYSLLVYISIFGILLDLVGLFFVLINEYNKTWNDVLTSSVYIRSEDLDEIYRAKGYNI